MRTVKKTHNIKLREKTGAEGGTLFAMMRVVLCLGLSEENHNIFTFCWISFGRDVNMF